MNYHTQSSVAQLSPTKSAGWKFARHIAPIVTFIFVVVFMTLFLFGCGANYDELEEYPPGYDAVITDVSILPTIRIAAMNDDDMLPFLVAETERQTELRGLDIQIFYFDEVSQQHDAFLAGEFDALMTDMTDLALLRSDGVDLRAAALISDFADTNTNVDSAISQESTLSINQTLFALPEGVPRQRVLAFSFNFLVGDVVVGEVTTPERSAEAVGTLIDVLTSAAERINNAEDQYKRLYIEQGLVANLVYDEGPVLPRYPQPVLPDAEQSKVLLQWLYDTGHISELLDYYDLIFTPNAP